MFQNWPMKDTKKYFDEVEIQRWNIKRFFASCPKFRYAFLRFSQATAISEFQNSLKIGFTSWERYLPGTSCVSNISPVLIDNNHSKILRFLILVKYTMQKSLTIPYLTSDFVKIIICVLWIHSYLIRVLHCTKSSMFRFIAVTWILFIVKYRRNVLAKNFLG